MAFRSASLPSETDALCESCGYFLNGLEVNPAGNCPECGEPLATSLDPATRKPSPIEIEWNRRTFWQTTGSVLFRKRKFFRETITRADSDNVRRFGRVHRWLASVLFGIAAAAHLAYMAETRIWLVQWSAMPLALVALSTVVFAAIAFALLHAVTRLAIIATAAESKFWGMRLPKRVLDRAMDFHAANYLPVGVLAVLTTVGYRLMLMTNVLDATSGVQYLVGLCLAVVIAAFWLFESFVIAMRRIRLANY